MVEERRCKMKHPFHKAVITLTRSGERSTFANVQQWQHRRENFRSLDPLTGFCWQGDVLTWKLASGSKNASNPQDVGQLHVVPNTDFECVAISD